MSSWAAGVPTADEIVSTSRRACASRSASRLARRLAGQAQCRGRTVGDRPGDRPGELGASCGRFGVQLGHQRQGRGALSREDLAGQRESQGLAQADGPVAATERPRSPASDRSRRRPARTGCWGVPQRCRRHRPGRSPPQPRRQRRQRSRVSAGRPDGVRPCRLSSRAPRRTQPVPRQRGTWSRHRRRRSADRLR